MHLAVANGIWFRPVLFGMAGGRTLDAVEQTEVSIHKFKRRHMCARKLGHNKQACNQAYTAAQTREKHAHCDEHGEHEIHKHINS